MPHMMLGRLLIGYGLGLGTAALAKGAGPAIDRVVRPAARKAIMGGMVMSREVSRFAAEAAASVGDLTAEAREELERQRAESQRSEGSWAEDGRTAEPTPKRSAGGTSRS